MCFFTFHNFLISASINSHLVTFSGSKIKNIICISGLQGLRFRKVKQLSIIQKRPSPIPQTSSINYFQNSIQSDYKHKSLQVENTCVCVRIWWDVCVCDGFVGLGIRCGRAAHREIISITGGALHSFLWCLYFAVTCRKVSHYNSNSNVTP